MQMNNSKVYGYARCSTVEQDETRQILAIKKYALDNNIEIDDRDIITDKASGKDFDRPGYQALLRFLRCGDTVIISELDRFSRSYSGMREEFDRLIKMSINLIVLDSPMISTANKSDLEKALIANIVFEILAYASAKEHEKIKARVNQGLQAARQRGVRFGRPKTQVPDNFYQVKERWTQGQITAKEAMATLGLKRTTFYKLVKDKAS